MISSLAEYNFYRFATTRYYTKFYIIIFTVSKKPFSGSVIKVCIVLYCIVLYLSYPVTEKYFEFYKSPTYFDALLSDEHLAKFR